MRARAANWIWQLDTHIRVHVQLHTWLRWSTGNVRARASGADLYQQHVVYIVRLSVLGSFGSRHRFRFVPPSLLAGPTYALEHFMCLAVWLGTGVVVGARPFPPVLARCLHSSRAPVALVFQWLVGAPCQSTRRWSHFLVLTLYLDANLQKELCGQLPGHNFYTIRDLWSSTPSVCTSAYAHSVRRAITRRSWTATVSSPSAAHSTRRSRTCINIYWASAHASTAHSSHRPRTWQSGLGPSPPGIVFHDSSLFRWPKDVSVGAAALEEEDSEIVSGYLQSQLPMGSRKRNHVSLWSRARHTEASRAASTGHDNVIYSNCGAHFNPQLYHASVNFDVFQISGLVGCPRDQPSIII